MKKYILALLLIAAQQSYGQKAKIVDSIPVIMLVCDTASYLDYSINGNKKFFPKDFNITWQFGYEVRKYHTGEFEICDFDNLGFDNKIGVNYCILQRLDQNKKPLPKSTVVWITKETK